MNEQRRKIMNDAARSLSMLLKRIRLNMPPMTEQVMQIHELHLHNLKNLLNSDLARPDNQLSHEWED